MQALVSHCEQWVAKFSLLLHELASAELADLYAHFASNAAALRAQPGNLEELAQTVALQKRLDSERSTLAARFEPLNHMFATLEKVRPAAHCHCYRSVAHGVHNRLRAHVFTASIAVSAIPSTTNHIRQHVIDAAHVQHEVTIPDAQRAQLASLPAEWTAFQAVIAEAGSSLEDAKENFRERVRGMVDAFSAEVTDVAATFAAVAPFTSDGVTTAQARLVLR